MPDDKLMSLKDWRLKGVDLGKESHDLITRALKRVYAEKILYRRFDALCDLIDVCEDIKHGEVSDLRIQALSIAMAIVDARTEVTFKKMVADRREFKAVDAEYMPWQVPPTRTPIKRGDTRKTYLKRVIKESYKKQDNAIEMSTYHTVKDKVINMVHLNGVEREQFRIFPSENRLKKLVINGEGENAEISVVDFDTSAFGSATNPNQIIFVVSIKGDMFAAEDRLKIKPYHSGLCHSSFFSGSTTLFAGTIQSISGELREIVNDSGHYMPDKHSFIALATFLSLCDLAGGMKLTLKNFRDGDFREQEIMLVDQSIVHEDEIKNQIEYIKQIAEYLREEVKLDRTRGDIQKLYTSLLLVIDHVDKIEKKEPDESQIQQNKLISSVLTNVMSVLDFYKKSRTIDFDEKKEDEQMLTQEERKEKIKKMIDDIKENAAKISRTAWGKKLATALLVFCGAMLIAAGVLFAVPTGGASFVLAGSVLVGASFVTGAGSAIAYGASSRARRK